MKALLIDNYDSYTYNLFQYLAEITGIEPYVIKNDEIDLQHLLTLSFDFIVISPGPGTPNDVKDFGVCKDIFKAELNIPILAICLGHQGLGSYFGAEITNAPEIMHGRKSLIFHNDSEIFKEIKQGFKAVRYHSLIVSKENIPSCLEVTCWTDDQLVMGLKHKDLPYWGLQFHPESILTEDGYKLIKNFVDIYNIESFEDPRKKNEYTIIQKELKDFIEAEDAFNALYKNKEYSFWLDSSLSDSTSDHSRYSYIGSNDGPLSKIIKYHSKSKQIEIFDGEEVTFIKKDIFEYLDDQINKVGLNNETKDGFTGGFVGYLGYGLKGELGGSYTNVDLTAPDAMFIFSDFFISFDHLERKTVINALIEKGSYSKAHKWIADIEKTLFTYKKQTVSIDRKKEYKKITFELDKSHAQYVEAVDNIKNYLFKGDTYEVNLTSQITSIIDLDPYLLYRKVRKNNPAPYSAFLSLGDHYVLSSSPERFLKISGDGLVESKPIKGTTKRGANDKEDKELITQLLNSEKEQAENLMITDLVRNDLGQVCEIGSVKVRKLMNIESYKTVHQMVTTIEGKLLGNKSLVDCIKATFPGGSMTGAPKIRTMEIIDELESSSRGIYSGSLGYISVTGNVDLNIVIRTIIYDDKNKLRIGAGGAITYQSNTNAEYEELKLKASVLIESIIETLEHEYKKVEVDHTSFDKQLIKREVY